MIAGPNGHGKTSLIEAMLYCEVFRSFRGAADRELVRFGSDGFHVETCVRTGISSQSTVVGRRQDGQWCAGESEPAVLPTVAGERRVEAGYDARTRQKRVRLDGAEPERLAEAIGVVRGVVLSPGDVALVAGSPRSRRQYLDVLLSLTASGYVDALGRYRRALRHRIRATAAEMPVWEGMLAEAGALIVRTRMEWVARRADAYRAYSTAVGERGASGMTYVTRTEPSASSLSAALERTRERDLARGRTSVGPHRDELRLLLDGRDLRVYGSAGQQRTAALALRLLEAATMRDATREGATICLDDAFAELDESRSRNLAALIATLADEGSQVVAAVPKESDLPAEIRELPVWTIRDGALEEAGRGAQ